MTKLKEKENKLSVNISSIDDDYMKWRQQDKEYNESYKKWRKQNKGTTGFYFSQNPNELTYQHGVGFIKDYPEAVESSALKGISHYIGMSIIFFIMSDILCGNVLPLILSYLGFDIKIDLFVNKTYGNPLLICSIYVLRQLLKVIYPIIICIKKLKLPVQVMYPIKIINKPLFKLTVPVIMFFIGTSYVLTRLLIFLMDAMNINTNISQYYNSFNTKYSILFFIITVILTPIISEFGIRCIFVQILRQFGDIFAIIIVSAVTAMMTFNLSSFCYIFINSVAVSYFLLRTGSIISSIIMRIMINLVDFIIINLYYNIDHTSFDLITSSMCLIFIIIGIICIKLYAKKHTEKLDMKISTQHLPVSEKIITMLSSKAILISISLIFILFILNLKIRI